MTRATWLCSGKSGEIDLKGKLIEASLPLEALNQNASHVARTVRGNSRVLDLEQRELTDIEW